MSILNEVKTKDLYTKYATVVEEPTIPWKKIVMGKLNLVQFLQNFNHHDEFYTIVSLRENKILWQFGSEMFMDYKPNEAGNFPVRFFIDKVHPLVRPWYEAFVAGLNSCVLEGKLKDLEFLKTRFVINLPMKKGGEDGTYMLVKQIAMPLAFDTAGRVSMYISSFFIMDKYKGEPLKPRFFKMGEPMPKNDEILLKETIKYLHLKKRSKLPPYLSAFSKLICKVPHKKSGNLAKEIEAIIKKEKIKKLSKGVAQTYLDRLEEKLAPLVNINFVNPEAQVSNKELEIMPDFTDTYVLFHFLNDCKILRLLELLDI